MPLIENGGRGFLMGVITGVGLAVAGRVLLGPLRPAGRPFAKATLKSGLLAMERAREKLAEYGETVEDLLAEARAEIAEEGDDTTATRTPAPAPRATRSKAGGK